MITSPNGQPLTRSFRPSTALAQAVTFNDITMHVQLTDGRTVSVPLLWFPRLQAARPEQRRQVEIGGGGRGLHWMSWMRTCRWLACWRVGPEPALSPPGA